MSYNCDTWKTKRIENFRIPVPSLFKSDRKDWHPDERRMADGTVEFSVCESTIRGKIDGETLIVSQVNISGEGSGNALLEIFEPAFRASSGILEASTVWEGGDSIQKLIVKNGEVTWEEIEI